MAHQIETMMYAKDVPWHELGTYVGDEPIYSEEAIVKAGQDWRVSLENLYYHGPEGMIQVQDQYGVIRDSDSSLLGIVTNRYKPIQNAEAFAFMDSLAEDGVVRYHTAGSLFNGRKIWLLAEVSDFDLAPHPLDITKPFVLLTNDHSGKGSLRMLNTSVRVVCNNTLTLALQKDGESGVQIRHTGSLIDKLNYAREVLGVFKTEFKKLELDLKTLTTIPMNIPEFNGFTQNLLPAESSQAINRREYMVERFINFDGAAEHAFTRYAALQAVTNELSHNAPSRVTKGSGVGAQFNSLFMGPAARMGAKALELLAA